MQFGVPVAMEIEASGTASAFRSTSDLLQTGAEMIADEADSMLESIVLSDSTAHKSFQNTEQKEKVILLKPKSAAAETGQKANGMGDLPAFIAAFATNCCMVLGCVCVFMQLRKRYPLMYKNNELCGIQPVKPDEEYPDSSFSWAKAAVFKAGLKDNIKSIGLDNALLIEFTELCMRIMAFIAVPMVGITGPLNYFCGGHAADTIDKYGVAQHDRLSYISFGNVEKNSWLYRVHMVMVWYVVLVVVYHVRAAQRKFLDLRFEWLETLPELRAKTILVEGIPEKYRSDDELRKYFDGLFGAGMVESAYVAKDTAQLLKLMRDRTHKLEALEKAKDSGNSGTGAEKEQESVLNLEIEELDRQIEEERTSVLEKSRAVCEVNTSKGFVTFKDIRDAELALKIQCTASEDEFVLSNPPDPQDVRWCDMVVDESAQTARDFIGLALVVGLYFAYMPLVIGISKVAKALNLGPLQPLWAGLAPTMGLTLMVAFLPTFLLLIFHSCFVLKANAFAQQKLQTWYFWFQVVFVLLITAIGGSVVKFTQTLFADPFATFGILGHALPTATHFYMNFIVLQWHTHAMNFLRYIPLAKFLGVREIKTKYLTDDDKKDPKKIAQIEEAARQKAEPEDQDYYGLGSRSARFTINMAVGIVFSTLCPPISILCFINFAVCRVVYGYLIPFAENKKADTGGEFWVAQLNHIYVALIIYCVCMTGVFKGRAITYVPCGVSALALIYVIHARKKFHGDFRWECLPFEKVNEVRDRAPDTGRYVQPELVKGV